MGRTLFDKLWDAHAVGEEGGYTILYVDRHILHDLKYLALEGLRLRGLPVRRPQQTFAVIDHTVPTERQTAPLPDATAAAMVDGLRRHAAAQGFRLFDVGDVGNGIVHVVGPEQGITLPGLTVCCGDSHSSTHGALGCLAFGIGSSEVEHVLATQTVLQLRPKTMRVTFTGRPGAGISGKDLILALIGRIGVSGGTGHAIEYAGEAIRALSVEGRMTLCNMSIEAGARAGMVAPDETTFAYVAGRPHAPDGADWDAALAHWRTLPSDEDAEFDREAILDVSALVPQVTWGTNPGMVTGVDGRVPDPAEARDGNERAAWQRALAYMGLVPGTPLAGLAIDTVFIGSCTNSRIEDLREAARILAGRKVAAGLRALAVPGSGLVRRQAEAEGLDRVFREAGFEWREPGCSMCVAMNGDRLAPGQRCASTSNRNFEGRQGSGGRTHLMSPAMAAAAAVTGRITDVRQLPAA